VIGRIAALEHDKGRPAKAEELYREALAMYVGTVDANTRYEATVLMGFSKTLLLLERPAEAESLIRKALPSWEGAGTFQRGLSLAILGRALFQQGKRADAEPLLKEGYASFTQKLDKNPRDEALLRSWLADLERPSRESRVGAERHRRSRRAANA